MLKHFPEDPDAERIQICKLGPSQSTEQGSYWAKVDGQHIGEGGRSHWHTHTAAMACARRFIMREKASQP